MLSDDEKDLSRAWTTTAHSLPLMAMLLPMLPWIHRARRASLLVVRVEVLLLCPSKA